jgi:shikimate 5-dehydrogenase
LGAGGVARAVVAGLCDHGCDVTLYNIIPEDAAALARTMGARWGLWEQRTEGDGSILVNCTSVGMWPDADGSPFPADRLSRYALVFDAVYNPIETRLLRSAAEAGCRAVSGVEMFVNQAAAQFRLWTGESADASQMRDLVVGELTEHG